MRCMCVCVHGYASLPGGSHSEMKESFTQVEVACRRKFCVCVCFVWSCPFWGDMRVRTTSCLAGFSVCVCMWLHHVFDPLFRVPIVVPLLPALDGQMRKYRCGGVCIRGCGFQLGTNIVKVILDTSKWPLPSAGGAFQRKRKPNDSQQPHCSAIQEPQRWELSVCGCVSLCVCECACVRLAPTLASCQGTYLTLIHSATRCDS